MGVGQELKGRQYVKAIVIGRSSVELALYYYRLARYRESCYRPLPEVTPFVRLHLVLLCYVCLKRLCIRYDDVLTRFNYFLF